MSIRIFLASLLAFLSVASPGNATITQAVGGPGGAPFQLRCPEGEIAVGVSASAGAWVDGMTVLCKAPRGRVQPASWAGGSGGGPQEVYCPQDLAITSVFVTFTRGNDLPREYVNTIGIICGNSDNRNLTASCILSGDTIDDMLLEKCSYRAGGGDFLGTSLHRSADYLRCPGDEVLTGLHGRAGNYVDAIGAICGPPPTTRPIVFAPVIINPGDRVDSSRVVTTLPPAVVNQSPANAAKPVLIPEVLGLRGQCKQGFVWREASAEDRVCVTPDSRERARVENRMADMRRDPAAGYGPMGCKVGFVWREAFANDLVCVDPAIRDLVREENARAAERTL